MYTHSMKLPYQMNYKETTFIMNIICNTTKYAYIVLVESVEPSEVDNTKS